MSSYEDDLRQALAEEISAGNLTELDASDQVFALLSEKFPVFGSKIDWKNVPFSIEAHEADTTFHSERFEEFFDEMCLKHSLVGSVLYAGDGAADIALEGALDVMRRALPAILDIPQHHYFVETHGRWCICLTMEGDMAYGQPT